ncbi:hypothetical protein BVRB_035950, partial [Beta vulgaris subsp. vulgaris]
VKQNQSDYLIPSQSMAEFLRNPFVSVPISAPTPASTTAPAPTSAPATTDDTEVDSEDVDAEHGPRRSLSTPSSKKLTRASGSLDATSNGRQPARTTSGVYAPRGRSSDDAVAVEEADDESVLIEETPAPFDGDELAE